MDYYAPCSLLCFEQFRIALTIWAYPVHRQIFPRIYLRISSSEGFGFSSRRDFPMRTIPGVQKPHWTAPCSRKDSWIGWRLPSCSQVLPPLKYRFRPAQWLALGTKALVLRPREPYRIHIPQSTPVFCSGQPQAVPKNIKEQLIGRDKDLPLDAV